MILNSFQKKFINYLIDNNYSNQYPLFNFYDKELNSLEISLILSKKNNSMEIIKATNNTLNENLINETFSSIHNIYLSIISIIDLIEILEKNSLARSYKKAKLEDNIKIGYPQTISLGTKGYDIDINIKFIEYLEKGIIIDEKLIYFKKKKYNTYEEIKYKRERKTIWISIIISIIIGLASLIINVIKL